MSKVTELKRRPAVPSSLDGAAADLWREIAQGLPADYFAPGDIPLLREYCLICGTQLPECNAEIERGGIMVNGKANPALTVKDQLVKQAATLATKLRLPPSSRTRPDSAKLRRGHGVRRRPWEWEAGDEFFDDDNGDDDGTAG